MSPHYVLNLSLIRWNLLASNLTVPKRLQSISKFPNSVHNHYDVPRYVRGYRSDGHLTEKAPSLPVVIFLSLKMVPIRVLRLVRINSIEEAAGLRTLDSINNTDELYNNCGLPAALSVGAPKTN